MKKIGTGMLMILAGIVALVFIFRRNTSAANSIRADAPEGSWSLIEDAAEGIRATFIEGESKSRQTTTLLTKAQAEAMRKANRERKARGEPPVYTDKYGNAYRSQAEAVAAIRNQKSKQNQVKAVSRRRTKNAVASKSAVKGIAPKPVTKEPRRTNKNRKEVPRVNKWRWVGGKSVPA